MGSQTQRSMDGKAPLKKQSTHYGCTAKQHQYHRPTTLCIQLLSTISKNRFTTGYNNIRWNQNHQQDSTTEGRELTQHK